VTYLSSVARAAWNNGPLALLRENPRRADGARP